MATPTPVPSADALLERLQNRTDDRPKSDLSSEEQLGLVVAAALDRKAEDLKVLHLGELSDVSDYFVLCSGGSQRQVQA
ncbi:MAG: RsfS/YbeB/iojap family protein, partial [Acidobacteriota bacterium]